MLAPLGTGETLTDRERRTIERLRQEHRRLKTERAELARRLLPWGRLPDLNLTPTEADTLKTLLKHDVLTRATLYHSLFFDADSPPDIKIADVMICKLRSKLPSQIDISTIRSYGWRMKPVAKMRVLKLMEADAVRLGLPISAYAPVDFALSPWLPPRSGLSASDLQQLNLSG